MTDGREEPPGIDAVFDEHMAQEFQHRDVEATMRKGLLDPTELPVTGAEQADKLLDPSLPSNTLMERQRPRRSLKGVAAVPS